LEKKATKINTVEDVLRELRASLENSEAEIEARIIVEHVLNLESSELISNSQNQLSKNQVQTMLDIRDKRNKEKIPLAYILEEAPFAGMNFFVNDDVLIPRPETELLINLVLDEIKERKIHQPSILDLATGSGCIAVALKKALPAAKVFASDISQASLNIAAINAKRLDAEISFVMGDYLDPFLNISSSPIAVPIMRTEPPYFDLIVSNPPYLTEEEYEKLEPELYHEPKHALVGFPYQHIKNQVMENNLLKDNGFMAFEFGFEQKDKLSTIFPKASFYKDLENNYRFLID
jgi:release factor glutamine methyltransferase